MRLYYEKRKNLSVISKSNLLGVLFTMFYILIAITAYAIFTLDYASGLYCNYRNEDTILLAQILSAYLAVLPFLLSERVCGGYFFGMNSSPFICIFIASVSITVFVLKLEMHFMPGIFKFFPYLDMSEMLEKFSYLKRG